MIQILVVEDDPNVRRLTCVVLEQSGYVALPAASGAAALEVLEHERVDLAVVDIMMPGIDGLAFTRMLRDAGNNLPVIVVTAKGTMSDKHAGFDAGADDYLVKPVDEEELVMRVGALLRRARINAEHRLQIGGTTLDSDALTVAEERAGAEGAGSGGVAHDVGAGGMGGATGAHTAGSVGSAGAVSNVAPTPRVQELPRLEFQLLFRLLSYPGKVFTRRQLLDDVWGPDAESDERTVDVHVSRLRERFGGNPDFEIVTVRGLGYKAVARGPESGGAAGSSAKPGRSNRQAAR